MKLVLYVVVILSLAVLTANAQVERLTNGGFESGSAGWITGAYGNSTVVTSGTYGVDAPEGTHFLDARLSNYNSWPKTVLTQSTVLPTMGIWYEVTGWIYPHLSGDPASQQASITVDWGDGTIERINPSIGDDWNFIGSAHFVQYDSPSPISVYLELYGNAPGAGDFVLFDDISVTEYSSAVPEPGGLSALIILAISTGGVVRRGRCRR